MGAVQIATTYPWSSDLVTQHQHDQVGGPQTANYPAPVIKSAQLPVCRLGCSQWPQPQRTAELIDGISRNWMSGLLSSDRSMGGEEEEEETDNPRSYSGKTYAFFIPLL